VIELAAKEGAATPSFAGLKALEERWALQLA
jgi:hypothetical protein